ncbi:MAG: hypothetical protein IJ375_04980 [Oscillospiraceae bacterium]|nr:hypothetical protein [Oscillospiraceae bacterium]
MKKQLTGLGLLLFGILLILADMNGIVKIPLLGDVMSVNSISLIFGVAGLGLVIYGCIHKDKE